MCVCVCVYIDITSCNIFLNTNNIFTIHLGSMETLGSGQNILSKKRMRLFKNIFKIAIKGKRFHKIFKFKMKSKIRRANVKVTI